MDNFTDKEYYSVDTLFRQSDSWEIEFDRDTNVIYIDNYYENPEDVYQYIKQRKYPLWKYNEERGDSPNGIEYLDCRIVDKVGHPTRQGIASYERLCELAAQYGYHRGRYHWEDLFEVNCFKALDNYDPKLQHFPHVDGNFGDPLHACTINFLVYMDKVENGGTAVYKPAWLQNNEQTTLLQPVEEIMDLDYIIPAKFNRAVLFSGAQMHGAYITDYSKYMDDWRYSVVNFLHPNGY